MRAFAGARDIISDYPVTVLGSTTRGLIHHPDLPPWIERRTSLQFDTRSHYMAGGKRVVGLVCESRTRNLIAGTCAQLLELGVPILGRYVQVESSRNDSRLVPRRTLIGRVTAIEDGMLILDDHADGYDRIAPAI
jgi:hypothetical protein